MADELRRLAVEFESESGRMGGEARAIVKRAAQNVKEQMQAEAAASSFRQIAPTISYDMSGNAFYSQAEVGPDRSRGGGAGLAGAYYGWPNGGGGSLSLDGPLDAEEPRMLKALDELLGGIL